ncbi:MAG: hypothetical protein GY801_18050 [bacterium]|nr:hypothetical protein [bacterium]
MIGKIEALLGKDAQDLLQYECQGIPKAGLHLPGPDFVDRIFSQTDRSIRVPGSLQGLFNHGKLAGSGFVSILPIDQGIEHSADASFAPT